MARDEQSSPVGIGRWKGVCTRLHCDPTKEQGNKIESEARGETATRRQALVLGARLPNVNVYAEKMQIQREKSDSYISGHSTMEPNEQWSCWLKMAAAVASRNPSTSTSTSQTATHRHHFPLSGPHWPRERGKKRPALAASDFVLP